MGKTMGRHGWRKGSYTIMSLKNPIRGPLYRPPWVVGGIHNPTIDPERHFNTQDRFETVSLAEMIKFWFYNGVTARCRVIQVFIPVIAVLMITALEQRREP